MVGFGYFWQKKSVSGSVFCTNTCSISSGITTRGNSQLPQGAKPTQANSASTPECHVKRMWQLDSICVQFQYVCVTDVSPVLVHHVMCLFTSWRH